MVEHSLSKLVLKEDVVLQEALEVVDHRLTLVVEVEVVPHILVMVVEVVVGHIPEMGEGHKMLTLEQLVVVHSQKEGEKEEEEEVIHEE